MAGLNNKEVKFAYADSSTIYNQATKLENIIYFIKNGGINIGDTSISNYITKVSELLNDKNYIRDIELDYILTDYPTKTEVEEALANLVNSAPEMLDTLNELAKAIDDNPNFAADIAEELAKKVDKVEGMGLSENDYSDEEKQKLENLRAYITDVLIGRVQTLEDKVDIVENKPAYDITDENIEDWNDAGEKVDRLANVAFTADYGDLINTPQNLSEFNDDTSLNERVGTLEDKMDVVENKPAYDITQENINDWNSKSASVENLHPVAFSGSYTDLENVPTQLSDFTDDTSLNYRVGILEEKTETLEGKVDVIENKPAYNITNENITDWNDAGQKVDQLVDVAFSADYNDLVNVPTKLTDFIDDTSLNERVEIIEDKVDIIEGKPAYNITSDNINDWNDAGQKVDQLVNVAFSGSYNDLSDVPTQLSDFIDDSSLNERVETLESKTETLEGKVETLEDKTETLENKVEVIENKPAYNITDASIEYWNEKQEYISDLETIREGAALGATALQSFIETDPTVPGHVKAITEADILKWNTMSSSIGDLTLATVAMTGEYSDLLHTPYIPEKLSDLDNDNYTVTDQNYVHTDNNYTTEEKNKLADLYNYDDEALDNRVTALEEKEETDPIFTAHIASHITDGSVNYWNEKQEYISDLETIRSGAALGATALQEHQSLDSLADGAEYDSTSHLIYLKHGETRLNNPINAADFIKDGMVSDVSIHKGTGDNIQVDCLIISFNTDSGHDDIEIPINRIFNPTNYYTKQDIEDKQYLQSETDPKFHAHIASHITDGSVNYWNNKQEAIPDSSFTYWNNKQEAIPDASFTYWNNKQDKLTDASIAYWNNKQEAILDASFTYWNDKQETISDLDTIRSGAALGATALQSFTETDPIFTGHVTYNITDSSIADWNSKQPAIPNTSINYWNGKQDKLSDASINYWNGKQDKLSDASINYWNNKQEAISDLETIRSGAEAGATALQEHQPIMTINGNTIVGEGNVDISGLPDVTSTDNNKILMVVNGEWQMVMPVFVYTGTTDPNTILGNDGDLYLQS